MSWGFEFYASWAFGVDVRAPFMVTINVWRLCVWFGWPFKAES
jgi:hypothetical protein